MSMSTEVSVPKPAASANEEFLLGFQRVEQELRAVPEQDLAPLNLDVPSAVATVLGAWPEIWALRDQVSKLPGFDVSRLDKLRDYALALAHAHGVFRGSMGPPDGIAQMAEELATLRDMLFADAAALAKRGVFDEARIGKLRSGPGYKSLAFDVVGLVQVFRERWADIAGRTATQTTELERAGQLAQQLVTAVGLKEQQPVSATSASLLRLQAFTVFVRAYDEVRRAVAFLRWHEEDAESIAPSLWAGRGTRAATEAPVPVAPAPGDSPAGESAAATSAPTAAPTPGVGLPGATPFTRS